MAIRRILPSYERAMRRSFGKRVSSSARSRIFRNRRHIVHLTQSHDHAKLGCDYHENREDGEAIRCAALCETVVSAGGSPDLRKDCACSPWRSSFAFAFSPLFAILTSLSLSLSRSRARPRPRPRLQGHRRNAAVVGNDAPRKRETENMRAGYK